MVASRPPTAPGPSVTTLAVRFAVDQAVRVVGMGVALLWPAGEIGWWPAWALIAVTLAWVVATGVVTLHRHPDLLAERLGPRPGAKRWGKVLMSVHGMLQLGLYVVAGLDRRYGWTGGMSVTAQAGALAACALGYGLVVWATASNPFFSLIARIQTERGHATVSGGPYRYVRHPAYAGSLLTIGAMPVLLASWPALALGLLDACLMVVRTILEDRTLRAELPGYGEYAERVRWRLVPGVW